MLHTDYTGLRTMHKRGSGSTRENNNSPGLTVHSQKFDNDPRAESKGANTIYGHPDVICIAEYAKNKLYFATLATCRREPRTLAGIHFFNIDDELVYNNFYNDFGPLNLACLYKDAHACLVNKFDDLPLRPFQDASMGSSMYNIRLQDCLNAIHKALAFGFFNFDDFDVAEYEKYEQMKNGDLNWTIPQKFIAFTGPSVEFETAYHPPERYVDYFTKNGVIAVVRLNKKTYEATRFTRVGIAHYEMFMPDGNAPPRNILNKFLHLAETTNGPIAVHCKAGLGRTGSLIAAYLIKHYGMSARESIAWMRICRPGSVIGHQQSWLEAMENELLRAGQQYRLKHHGDANMILHHKRGIYSVVQKLEQRIKQENTSGAESIGGVGREMWQRNSHFSNTTNMITKPGITSIFGTTL